MSPESYDGQQRICFVMFVAFMPPVKDGLKKQLVSAIPDGPAVVVATREPIVLTEALTYFFF